MNSENTQKQLKTVDSKPRREQDESPEQTWERIVSTDLWTIVEDAKNDAEGIWDTNVLTLDHDGLTVAETEQAQRVLLKGLKDFNRKLDVLLPKVLDEIGPIGDELIRKFGHRFSQIYSKLFDRISFAQFTDLGPEARRRYFCKYGDGPAIEAERYKLSEATDIYNVVFSASRVRAERQLELSSLDARLQFLKRLDRMQHDVLVERCAVDGEIDVTVLMLAPVKIELPGKDFNFQSLSLAHWELIQRAMNELIYNAIRAILPGGKIAPISIMLEQDEDFFILSVSDKGPGISAEQLPRIFGETFRSKSGGTGKGLVELREDLKHVNGTIDVQSILEPLEHHGTTAIVQMPRILPFVSTEDIQTMQQ